MVIKNDLSAMVGRHSRRSSDSATVAPARGQRHARFVTMRTSRVMRGALPSSTSSGIVDRRLACGQRIR